jgi:predicted nucleic acid-binding protein
VSLVLDSSVTLSWCFKDERTEATQAVLHRVAEEGALVPTLWRFEVANGLQMGVRRKRIDRERRDLLLANLAGIEIAVDPDCDAQAWSASVRLADRHGLTLYDAVYLELAQRQRLELATLDSALLDAARTERVPVVGFQAS